MGEDIPSEFVCGLRSAHCLRETFKTIGKHSISKHPRRNADHNKGPRHRAEEAGQKKTFRIVGGDEIYNNTDYISIDSTMAKGLLKKEVGPLDEDPQERHQAMTWMQRLKRVFNIDIETCESCGGRVKVIASIEDPSVIEHILKHLKQKEQNTDTTKPYTVPFERAPPQADLFC